jgi:hypothetical protein
MAAAMVYLPDEERIFPGQDKKNYGKQKGINAFNIDSLCIAAQMSLPCDPKVAINYNHDVDGIPVCMTQRTVIFYIPLNS